MTHYFLALRFNKKTHDRIHQVSQYVKEIIIEDSYKRWVDYVDYHLTLHFFGPLEDKEAVMNIMKRLAIPPLSLTFSHINGFGQSGGYRVLYLEPKETDVLRNLYESIQEELSLKGFPTAQRPFRPHVTLAKKCQTPWNKENVLSRINRTLMATSFPIDVRPISVALYKIEPNKIPTYRVVYDIPIR
ncbi:RNA 2',3'-cyclic phosphodiesterase [Halolactibacillus miurensis]|uniref:RNA 2',3'-cyclic phosphodiesterase n=1 Tax=Halolactibacillus miurensis TaxID=306541 RepID=A0A1I6V718_9BACI|nr:MULTISPECIES: RNA 2',3'-cyclic phosphodiesterase [Halolactibacillus]GEM05873.1 RNA 2',3'-cyclic phosphodiesterase [Halolactibacillus miurensis]SFT09501.1 2'-5' RNA ligase [Halolactibacillus miurensis]